MRPASRDAFLSPFLMERIKDILITAMGLNEQSNNKNWNLRSNLAAAREFYVSEELNNIETTSAASVEFPSDNYSPYVDSDIGSSLQEVKNEGNIAMASKKKSQGALLAAAITVSSIGAVVVINNIADTKPLLEHNGSAPIVVNEKEQYKLLTYDFKITYKSKATLFLYLSLDGKENESKYELKWDDEDEEVENEGLMKSMRFSNTLDKDESPYRVDKDYEGEYEFRISCQFGFGKNSLLSYKGYIG